MYKNYSVLFVDDEVNILNSLRRGLMDEEYTCHFATSGKIALEIMEKEQIHVIVTDMRMPEMTGLALLKTISDLWPKTIKIVLSGYTQIQQILTTINQVDIFKFITKPWGLEEFSVVIKKSLDYYILQEQNDKYKIILEAKNQAYQNILKRIDEVIIDAKKSSEILGICGKAILGFGKSFDLNERIKYACVLNMQDTIFEIFSKAITNEKREYSIADLVRHISELIGKDIKTFDIEKEYDSLHKLNVNIKMLEATLLSLKIIFSDEFDNYGFIPNILINEREKFAISIISPKANSNNEIDEKSGLSILDVKLSFAKSVVEKTLELCQISFQAIKKNDSLVIGIAIKE